MSNVSKLIEFGILDLCTKISHVVDLTPCKSCLHIVTTENYLDEIPTDSVHIIYHYVCKEANEHIMFF